MPKKESKPEWRDRYLETVTVRAGDILPHALNPKIHPAQQLEPLGAILEDVGKVDSLKAYRSEREGGKLVYWDGHARMGLRPDEVWRVDVYDLNDAEADLLLASFDPVGWQAEQSRAQLESLMQGIQTGNASLQEFLSKQAEEAGIIPTDAKAPGAGGDEFDTTPEETQTRVKYGDLWQCGEHRVLCGDATKAEDVARIMAAEKADLCFTSPPYATQRDYENPIDDWEALMCGVFANLPMSEHGQVLVNLGLIHRDGEWIPYWERWIEWMREFGWRRFGWYVWDQGHGLPGDWNGRLAPSHEWIFHFNRQSKHPIKWLEKKTENIRIKTGKSLRNQDGSIHDFCSPEASLQTHKIPDSVIRETRQMGGINDHPAPFSVSLALHIIQSWDGIVYEPFAGSGTVLIACERINRQARLIEIEPKYVNGILSRWEAETCME